MISDNILQAIAMAVSARPDSPCVIEDGSVYTYAQMWTAAQKVASRLDADGARRLVPVLVPKSYEYIYTVIGVWLSSRAFVPLDPKMPEHRRRHILDEVSTVSDDAVAREHWAYVIYTSGSTGDPKGVIVSHSGLSNLARCQSAAFGTDSDTRYLFFLSTCFDASISDILATLTVGGALVIETGDALSLATDLLGVVRRRGVTHMDIPPSLLKMILPTDCPPTLRTIVIGGESADIDTVRRWAPVVNLVNVYGPTEATVCTSLCRCQDTWRESTLGHVLDGVSYRIGPDDTEDEGELWISGDCLAIGYLNKPELTAEKFPVIDGVRYYRTADKVRRTAQGEYVFLGRIDRQFKLNGQLIEPEEIERNIMAIQGVEKVAVILHRTTRHRQSVLTACVQTSCPQISAQLIQDHLRQVLPVYMIPTVINLTTSLATTITGKVDLSAVSVATDSVPATADMSPREREIARVIAEVLEVDAVGPDDHLCQLGASSLQTLMVICALEGIGICVNASDLRTASSPRELARLDLQPTGMAMSIDQLSPEWQNLPEMRHTAILPQTCRNLLLTGATGFLGSHICHQLLTLSPDTTVNCLVRCKDPDEGMERLRSTFRRYHIMLSAGQWLRINVVPGDITDVRLGLSDPDYERLAADIDAVCHCAATVNMMQDYENLRQSNVEGVVNVLRFACHGRHKTLHYASTLSVRVATDQNTGVALESDMLQDVTTVYGGYGQTKVVAEKILMQVAPAQCRVRMYRYGLLCGDTRCGVSAPRDFLNMFFRGASAIGSLPFDTTDSLAVDITPIDYAADLTARLMLASTPHMIYHIAGNPLLYNELALMLKVLGVVTDIVGYDQWIRAVAQATEPRCQTRRRQDDIDACRMALCRFDRQLFDRYRYLDLMQTTAIRFDMANVREVLGDVACEKPLYQLIKSYVQTNGDKV